MLHNSDMCMAKGGYKLMTTCAVQRAVLHGNCLSMTVARVCLFRRKALLALSCLMRHCDAALDAFRGEGGLARLVSTAAEPDPRQQRCALAVPS